LLPRLTLAFVCLLTAAVPAAAQVRIVTYNSNNGSSAESAPRDGVSTILDALSDQNRPGFARPVDILLLQESANVTNTTQGFVNLLNSLHGGGYARGLSNGATSGGGRPTVVFNTDVVQLIAEVAINTTSTSGAARATMRYQFRPIGYDSSADFYVYNSHFKASDTSTDRARRGVEAAQIRTNADALGEGAHIIYAGDLNLYRSTEQAFVNFTNTGAGQAFDPIDRIGTWQNGNSFRDVHTQSPVTNSTFNGQVTGGMDDRFDFQLVTGEVLDGRGFAYITNSYWAFGNTGTHTLDGPLSSGSVTALQSYLPGYTTNQVSSVINAIMTSSDHLPVVADYQLPARLAVTVASVASRVITGAALTGNFAASNSAPVAVAIGADRLEYTITGSNAVIATGSGTNLATQAASNRTFTFDTATAGARSGTLRVATSSPQAANPVFTQTVNVDVLHHAAPSFAANSAVSSLALDFGTLVFGEAAGSRSFSLHNRAGALGAAWTARLDLLGVVETSDPADMFSTALSPFANLAAGSSVSSAVQLATMRLGTFSASYSLAFADENLPGATALGSLALNVTGTVSGTFNIAAGQTRTIDTAITGTGAVSKSGDGRLVLSTANSFDGGVVLSGGQLRVADVGALGIGLFEQTGTNSVLEIDTGGRFTNAFTLYRADFLQGATLAGAVNVRNAVFDVSAGETSIISGAVSGSGGVTKTGSGTLVLTASNSFTGAIDVQAGLLELAGSASAPSGGTPSGVGVSAGAVLLLSASDRFNNTPAVTLSGGTITRGSGVSEVFGDLNLTTASFLDFGGGTTGTLAFGAYTPGSLLAVNNFFQGNTLTFASNVSGSVTNTAFFTFDNGFTSNWNGSTFTITAIPEPSTYLAAALLLAVLLLLGRQRTGGSKKF
jgi:autotransporter-associated beta strand protein